ncbi:MAG: hypothetical protein AB1512_07675 [Thermodesulfobacteriota bacterium]
MGIHLSGGAEVGAAVCHDIVREFLSNGSHPECLISIRRVQVPEQVIPGWPKKRQALLEKRLPDAEVLEWLREADLFEGGFPLSEESLCSYCLGALHVFDPVTAAGYAFLLERGPGYCRPLYRLLWMYFAQVLGQGGGCFLHGAALQREGSGYLFLGDSGAGKSTVAGLLREGVILSDDSPILTGNGNGHWLYPSPFHQMRDREGFQWESLPEPVPLTGLFFLVKGDEPCLEEISRKEALSQIISRHIHFFGYLSREAKLLLFDLFHEISHTVPAYFLHFSRHGDVWPTLRDVRGGGIK